MRSSRQVAERFVGKLKDFHDSLDPVEQSLLTTVLQSARGPEVLGHGFDPHGRVGGSSGDGWNDLVWWLTGEDDAESYRGR